MNTLKKAFKSGQKVINPAILILLAILFFMPGGNLYTNRYEKIVGTHQTVAERNRPLPGTC